MHGTKECRRRNVFEADKLTQFPPPIPPRKSSAFSTSFSPFFQETSRPKSNHM